METPCSILFSRITFSILAFLEARQSVRVTRLDLKSFAQLMRANCFQLIDVHLQQKLFARHCVCYVYNIIIVEDSHWRIHVPNHIIE